MHDLDGPVFEAAEFGQQEAGEGEQQEFLEILAEMTQGSGDRFGWDSPRTGEPFNRVGEAELAAELLEVQGTAEFDRFLRRLLARAAGVARGFAGSETGRALGGILKKAAGQALPVIGRGVGAAAGPRYADFGEHLGRDAAALFGLELEGLSGEDREFEVAKAFVRFANAAAKQASRAPTATPPAAAAAAAATSAARQHAPGLLPSLAASGGRKDGQHSGRWERHGDRIVILGV